MPSPGSSLSGCDRQRGEPLALASPSPEAAPSAAPARESRPPLLSPKRLLADYEKNEVAADARYKGKVIALPGVVEEIRKSAFDSIFVDVATGDRFRKVSCNFSKSAEAQVAELEKGQLVQLRGVGGGSVMSQPLLKDCALVWAGKKPDELKGKQAVIDAKHAAKSLEMCGLEIAAERTGRSVEEVRAAIEKGAGADSQARQLQQMIATAKSELDRMGVPPLDCRLPLLLLAATCDDLGSDMGPECRAPEVKRVVDNLQR